MALFFLAENGASLGISSGIVEAVYITGFPKESDLKLTTATTKLQLPKGSTGLLVKNLYLSCDPYMRSYMTKQKEEGEEGGYILLLFVYNIAQGLLHCLVIGLGVAKVLESGDPKFKPGVCSTTRGLGLGSHWLGRI
ncbi:putative oxidoreductase [Rosa chinensis]|uniref:Putative oxidoreductase n=1 Tax=Rosa chinensis TaxID=74649 RepID=A0A2P6REP0_ROSCH|nr:putative oxidoreductase [Rosa chinensis]